MYSRRSLLAVGSVLCFALYFVLGVGDIASAVAAAADPSQRIDYNRQIRPLLSNYCFKCHGPDAAERQSGLRLDDRAAAARPAESGRIAVVPHDVAKSELVRRLFSSDAAEAMPPPDENKRLRPEDKELLKKWISQGAPYQTHWAFETPRRPAVPAVEKSPVDDRTVAPLDPIDAFVRAKLARMGAGPSAEADRQTLVRRLALDLTGLPPTISEIDAFLADRSPTAYESLVDRLLASPHFGERMAVDWLDAARFADTNGFHIDNGRDMTVWRKWVIDAFNRNLPYDQFTIEQLAGDLLPGATLEQKIASGFNRNHMINFEGGAIAREYHNAYVVDRVNTTGAVWLGLTVGCAQCHDHKYDPLTQREFYQLYAFFHNVPENGLDGRTGNSAPLVKFATPEHQRQVAELKASHEKLQNELAAAELALQETPADDASRGEKSRQIADLKKRRDARKKEVDLAERSVPSVMVMEEMAQPRDTFVLVRGQYDKPGEKVSAAVPAFLPPLPADSPNNRLGLARWLVDPAHPLTARVTVNRYWQMLFGQGLVKTTEDFGSQGEPPTHADLLDWLAVEFQAPQSSPGATTAHAWNVKALVKRIVMSATYRQSSVRRPVARPASPPAVSQAAADGFEDPENRWLARGPRFRLQAEFLRDQALKVSGLLNREIGGRSVSPYQPAGLWEELMARADGDNWTAQKYTQSHGADLYKRTMYTFWKRTCPPASLATLDAPDRETCVVRRARTNTPLQALVLMNDPTYVEASRKLAERVLLEGGATLESRVEFVFRTTLARSASPAEAAVVRRVYATQLSHYQRQAEAAEQLLAVGESTRNDRLPPAELAAWTMVANMLLNLDETLTRG